MRNVIATAFSISMLAMLVLVTGCSKPSTGAGMTPASAASTPTTTEQSWTFDGEDGLNATLATPDLGLGEQRFALVLSDLEGIVRFPVINFDSYWYPSGYDGDRVEAQSASARFSDFPLGTRGIHVTRLDFNETGDWGVEASVPRPDGSSAIVEARFEVMERPMSVAEGDQAPPSRNRTIDDVDSIAKLTTGSLQDERLYQLTIEDAVSGGRPFVVVFASPAFCTNAVCGPQVEVASELADTYGDQVDFIHVDIYDNPDEIQGDLSRAIESPLLDEWGLVSQEWTYVVNGEGTVTARFENFVSAEELSAAIEELALTG